LAGGENLEIAPIPELNAGAATPSLYVEFDAFGSSLAARAYDAPGRTLLQSVFAIDNTYPGANLSGVLVSANDIGSPILGVWDDVSARAVCEPGTLALAFTVLGGAIALRRPHRDC
jgi:hypothetical protein